MPRRRRGSGTMMPLARRRRRGGAPPTGTLPAGNAVAFVTLTSYAVSGSAGDTRTLIATAENATHVVLTGRAFSVVSSAPGTVSVTMVGNQVHITFVATGAATLTVTSEGIDSPPVNAVTFEGQIDDYMDGVFDGGTILIYGIADPANAPLASNDPPVGATLLTDIGFGSPAVASESGGVAALNVMMGPVFVASPASQFKFGIQLSADQTQSRLVSVGGPGSGAQLEFSTLEWTLDTVLGPPTFFNAEAA